MKQFSTVLNIVLIAAVAVLYFFHFSDSKKIKSSPILAAATSKDSCPLGHVIAYVELDSLNNNVGYIKTRKKELETEQDAIAKEYENAYHELEAEKNNFLKKGNAITQNEAEEFQSKLMQKQQQVEATKQSKGQTLAAKGARVMEDMQRKLKDFLTDYNKDRKYSYIFAVGTGLDYMLFKDSAQNITSEIVKGLNEKMNKKGN